MRISTEFSNLNTNNLFMIFARNAEVLTTIKRSQRPVARGGRNGAGHWRIVPLYYCAIGQFGCVNGSGRRNNIADGVSSVWKKDVEVRAARDFERDGCNVAIPIDGQIDGQIVFVLIPERKAVVKHSII